MTFVPKFSAPTPASASVYTVEGRDNSLNAHEQSFRALMLEHQSMVFSIALRILGDRFLAEEAAQDVFLELHAKLDDLESPDHILHWLRRATAHRAIDRVRQRERRPELSLDRDDLPEIAVPIAPGDLLLSRQIRQLVASLPVTPRTVITLRYQEDMSIEEIAAALDLPPATVKSHLKRTLRLLREKAARVLR